MKIIKIIQWSNWFGYLKKCSWEWNRTKDICQTHYGNAENMFVRSGRIVKKYHRISNQIEGRIGNNHILYLPTISMRENEIQERWIYFCRIDECYLKIDGCRWRCLCQYRWPDEMNCYWPWNIRSICIDPNVGFNSKHFDRMSIFIVVVFLSSDFCFRTSDVHSSQRFRNFFTSRWSSSSVLINKLESSHCRWNSG